MEWVETTGRTLEEAKDAALDELGVDEADAEFDVLEEPKVGLFGRLRSEARVRARVRPTQPRPKEDRRDRRRQRDRKQRSASEAAAGPSSANGDAGESSESSAVRETPAKAAPRQKRASAQKEAPRPRAAKKERGSDVDEDRDVPLTEQASIAEEFLHGLLTELGADASVATRSIDEDTVEVAVTGGDLGLLIGPKGATLTALQDLTRTVVQRRTGARNGRLIVDVSGYRQKRREALERFTKEVVAAVQASGERKVLEPMHPADRKVVHDTVNTLLGVRTTSEGEEPYRRVVIMPDSDA
ncbi:MAG: Jag N-terminal domain-containing protein [Actinomycetota bacterium]|nr:Jag N-terminal domain-containing protein [Actinomycetota bacterium]